MKISEKIRSLFRRRPPATEEQRAARAKAESERDQIRQESEIRRDTQVPPF
jgi:hypothetical protein